MIMDKDDKLREEQYIGAALKNCLYPRWTKEKGKKQLNNKQKKQAQKKKQPIMDKQYKDIITLSYIRGITEPIQRAMKKHMLEQ